MNTRKSRLFRSLAALLAVTILLSLVPVLAEESRHSGNLAGMGNIIPSGSGFSNSTALKTYINRTMRAPFSNSQERANSTGILRARMKGDNAKLYDGLLPKIKSVAAGNTASTVFKVSLSSATKYKKSTVENYEYGLESVLISVIRDVFEGVLQDCPYELYWFDKTMGIPGESVYYDYNEGSDYYQFTSIEFAFTVAKEYSASGTKGTFKVNTSKAKSIQTAAANAKKIVDQNNGKSDTEKLRAYKNEICRLNEYNSTAVSDSSTPYGNPWQLVWVFDGDPKTKVVCEGYSKAFSFLCELSTFKGKVSCMLMTGVMYFSNGDGAHMWNVVTMPDTRRYLVDVTNCDIGSTGSDDLFLAGYIGKDTATDNYGNERTMYVYNTSSGWVGYVFDKHQTSLYGKSDEELHFKNYKPGSTPPPATPTPEPDPSGKCGTKAKWTLDKSGTLKITGSGKVTSAPWSKYSDRVKKISIGDSITSIPKNAFRDCYKATKATVGKKVKEIKAGAFRDCDKLKTVIFNGTALKKVGTKAFSGIAAKVVFKCPKSKLSAYKKLLQKAGAPKKAVFKKK